MGALNWSPEITKHNQILFKKEQATIAAQATPVSKGVATVNFPFISARELTATPVHIDWIVENFIEQGSLNLLFGEPGAGKSLFALDWAFCIAIGLDWHDSRTKQTDVVVIAGEGHAGLSRRFKALEVKYQMQVPENLYISEKPADLMDLQNAQWVADAVKGLCQNPGLVIVDTFARNMTGDENNAQDVGKFINNLEVFMKPLGAAVLVVHHSGHSQKDRSRGSSSIRAAMDAEFSATKSDGGIILACHKAKDFEALKPMQFGLKVTDLGWTDADGEQMTSVYLEHQGEATGKTKGKRLSARDDAILTSLNEAIAAHGVDPNSEIKLKFGGFDSFVGKLQKIVHVDYWRDKAYQSITVDCAEDSKQDALRKAFKRCRDKLFNDGFTIEHGDYVWRVFD